MKKKKILFFKITGLLIFLILLSGGLSFWYVNKTFLTFENGYDEQTNFSELTKEGYTFFDRNNNGKLDVYEDHRHSIKSARS